MGNRLESDDLQATNFELPPQNVSAVYRISQEPCDNCAYLGTEITGQINFQANDATNEVGVTDTKGNRIFGFYTKPAPYISGDKNQRIIDIAVFASTREEAKQVFETALLESAARKQEHQKYIEENILPIIRDIPSVVVIVGRGDVYDLDRWPTPDSDIDLMLFTAFESYDTDSKNNLLRKLLSQLTDRDELGINYTYYEISTKGFNASSTGLKKRTGAEKMSLGFDIISFPGLLTMLGRATDEKTGSLVGAYARRALFEGRVLSDKSEGIFDGFRDQVKKRLRM